MSWIKNKKGHWSRPKSNYERSISVFFLLDHDVLLKVGELVRNIHFENSRKLYGLKNQKLQFNKLETFHRLHQDIQMYGICHSILKCPINQIKYNFKWTKTYSISSFWPTWLGIVENIRILCEIYYSNIIMFALTGNINPPLISEIIPITPGGYRGNMMIGVSKIVSKGGNRLCIRDFRDISSFHPEHLLEFLNCDMSQLKDIHINTLYV